MPLFQHKAVRDLQWMFESPALLSAIFLELVDDLALQELFRKNIAKVQYWDQNPGELEEYLLKVPRVYKLGIYAESLFRFALERFDGVSGLASNLAVYRDKQAIGEFDFCVRLENDVRFAH